MEKYKYGWEPTEKDLQWIRETQICGREQLLAAVRERQALARQAAGTDERHSVAYYKRLDALFDRFFDAIGEAMLFEELEPCWIYDFTVDSRGARLSLRHIGWMDQKGERFVHSLMYNAEYELLTVSCNMLSVEEFAAIYGVERMTVLQWIRRGKIRSVRRIGKQWRISELTELPGHKYVPGNFSWHDELSDLPDEFAYLREPSTIQIAQDKADPSRYNLTIYRMNRLSTEPHIEFREGLTAKEREKLELTLLSHPLVDCSSEHEKTW